MATENLTKNIEIVINVTDKFTAQLDGLIKKIGEVSPNLDKMGGVMERMASALNSFNVPASFDTFIKSVKDLDKIDVPNLNLLATGMKKLVDIGTPPDLSGFATELTKFNGIDLPKVNSLADGITALSKAIPQLAKTGDSVSKVIDSLKLFNDIKLPNITSLTSGIENLTKIKIDPSFAASVKPLLDVLGRLNSMELPTNIVSVSNALKKLTEINFGPNTQAMSSFITELSKLSGVQLPAIKDFVSGLRSLEKVDVGNTVSRITALNTAITQLAANGGMSAFTNFASSLGATATQLGAISTSMGVVANSAQNAGNQVNGFFDGMLGRMSRYFQYIVVSDIIKGVQDIVGSVVPAIREYDQAIADMSAVTSATRLESEQLGKTLLALIGTSKFSMTQMAEGMTTFAQAGWGATEVIKGMPAITTLAVGTLSSLNYAVDLVTSTLKIFNFGAEETSRVTDLFAVAINKSKLTIESLRTSFNYIGPIAADAGISLEELTATLMALSNSGMRSSTMGTSLRNVINSIVTPNKELASALEKNGITLDMIDPKFNSFNDILIKLRGVVSTSKEALDEFGKRGASAILTLTSPNNNLADVAAQLYETGVSARMAAEASEGLDTKIKVMKNSAAILAVQIGKNGLEGALSGLASFATSAFEVFTKLGDTKLGALIQDLAMLSVAVTAATVVWGLFKAAMSTSAFIEVGAALKSLVSLLGLTSGAFLTTTGPILAIVAVITALTALVFSGTTAFTDYRKAVSDFTKTSDEFSKMSVAVESFNNKIKNLDKSSSEYSESTKSFRKDLLDIATKSVMAADGTREIASAAAAAAAAINPLTGEIIDGGKALADYNKELEKANFSAIGKAADAAVDNLKSKTSEISRFVQDIKNLWKSGGTTVSFLFSGDKDKEDYLKQTQSVIDRAREIQAAWSSGKMTIKEFQDAVGSLDDSKGIVQVKELKDVVALLSETGGAAIKKLLELGSITFASSTESVKEFLKELGYTGEKLDAAVLSFEKMKNSMKDTPTSQAAQWAKDYEQLDKNINKGAQTYEDFINKYVNLGGKLKDGDIEFVKSLDDRKRAAAEAYKEIQTRYEEAMRSAGSDKNAQAEATKQQILAEKELAEVVKNINVDISKSEAALGVFRVQESEKWKEKAISDATGTGQAIGAKLAQIEIDYKAKISAAVNGAFEPKDAIKRFKEYEAALKEQLATLNSEITNSEAVGAKSAENAQAERLRNTVETNKKLSAAAKDLYDNISKQQREGESERLQAAKLSSQHFVDLKKSEAEEQKNVIKRSIEDVKNLYTQETSVLKEENAKRIDNITAEQLKGNKSYAQANQEKLNSEIQMYQEMYAAAVKYYSDIASTPGATEKDKSAALQKAIDAEKQYYKVVGDARLADLKADSDYTHSIEKSRVDLAQKLEQIEHNLHNKLRELNKKYIEDSRKVAQSIKDIYEQSDDLIRGINQRGMTAAEKEADNLDTVYEKINEGQALLKHAYYWGDKEEQARAQKLLEQARSMGSNLQDQKEATNAVNAATEGLVLSQKVLQDVLRREYNERVAIAEAEAQYKARNARVEENEKEAAAKRLRDQVADIEVARHAAMTANLAAEISQYDTMLSKAKELAAVAGGTTASGKSPTTTAVTDKAQVTQAVVELPVKLSVDSTDLKTIKENTVQTLDDVSQMYSQVMKQNVSATKESGEATNAALAGASAKTIAELKTIAEEGYMSFEENGKIVYTNLTTAQRDMFKDMADIITGVGTTLGDRISEGANIANENVASLKNNVQETANAIKDSSDNKIIVDTTQTEKALNTIETKVSNFETTVDNISGTEAKVSFSISTPDKDPVQQQIDTMFATIKEIDISKNTVEIGVEAEELNSILDTLRNFKDEIITVKIALEGAQQVIEFSGIYNELKSKEIQLKPVVDYTGLGLIEYLKYLLESVIDLASRTLTINVSTDTASKALQNIIATLENIFNYNDKTVTVTVLERHDTVSSGESVSEYADGGSVFRRLLSPFISAGSGSKDDVPALLMKNEFVQPVKAVQYYGVQFMEMIRNLSFPKDLVPRFATGGPVGFHSNIDPSIFNIFSPSFKKKMLETLGIDHSDISTDNSITTELGVTSLNMLSNSFSEAVAGLQAGGSIDVNLVNLVKNKGDINAAYNREIAKATITGNTDVAKLLAQEKADILAATKKLQDELKRLKTEYDEYVAERKKTYDKNTASEVKSYKDTVEKDKSSYDKSTSSADKSYGKEKASYDKTRSGIEEDLKQAISDVENGQYSAMEYAAKLRELENSIKERVAAMNAQGVNLSKLLNPDDEIGLLIDSIAGTGSGSDSIFNKSSMTQGHPAFNLYKKRGFEIPDWRYIQTRARRGKPYATVHVETGELDQFSEGLRNVPIGGQVLSTFNNIMEIWDTEEYNFIKLMDEYDALVKGIDLHALKSYNPLSGNRYENGEMYEGHDISGTVLYTPLGRRLYDFYAVAEHNTIKELSEVLSSNKISAEKSRLNNEYSIKFSDLDASFQETTDSYNTEKAERDKEYKNKQVEYSLSHTDKLTEMKASYDKDLKNKKDAYDKDVAKAKADELKSIADIKSRADKSVSDRKAELVKTLQDLNTTRQTNITTATSGTDRADEIPLALTPGMSIDELIKRLSKRIMGFNTGGIVPQVTGSIPGVDSILALLSPNEGIINERAVRFFGTDFINSINRLQLPKFNLGGIVNNVQKIPGTLSNLGSSSVMHKLDLTLNGTHVGELQGSQFTIETLFDVLERAQGAQMRY